MANYASSMLQGAGTGAAAGAAAGPWGALAGGALGTLAGFFSAYEDEQDAERKAEILEAARKQFNLGQEELKSMMDEYYANPQNFLGTAQDVVNYRDAINKYNPDSYVYDFKEFSYTNPDGSEKTVEDFINPYYDKIIDSTSRKVQHSAAGAGVGRGTGAANAIAEAVAKKDDELYKTALNEYNADRTRSYQEWSGNITAMQNKLNQLKAAADSKLALQGNLAQDYTQQRRNRATDYMQLQSDNNQGNLQLATAALMI